MKLSLKTSCGVEALEHLLLYRRVRGEDGNFYMSIRSFINLAEDVGVFLKAYWVSAEDLGVLKAPYVLYAPDQKHFVALKRREMTPWLSIPKRVVVITDEENNRFQELSEKETLKFKGAKGPSMPSPPTAAQSAKDWAAAMPAIYEAQLKYAPLQAQQEVDLAKQYAGQYGMAMRDAQEAMYPGTSKIQETLANQSLEGMQSGMPMWAKDQYLNELRANLGSNVGSGIAADYTSRGVMQMGEEWKRYNQNLGLTVSGRQPLAQAQTPMTGKYSQEFTPASVMSLNASNFGSMASMYNAQSANQSSMFGSVMGAGGTALGAGLGAAAVL